METPLRKQAPVRKSDKTQTSGIGLDSRKHERAPPPHIEARPHLSCRYARCDFPKIALIGDLNSPSSRNALPP